MAIVKEVSYKGQNRTDVLSGKLRIEDGNNRMILFDGTVNRMLIGLNPDGGIGIYISKPGEDVITDVFI